MERLPESRVQFDIAAEEAESAEAMQRAVRKVGNQIALPGFRKGKAPRAMIEQVYGTAIFQEEATRYLMTDLYRQALDQSDVVPVGDPEVEIVNAEPLAFKVIVAVYPDIDPGNYRDIRIDPIDASLNESLVDEMLETLRKANSPWVDPRQEGLQVGAGLELTPKSRYPREGDQVTIDYSVQAEGEAVEDPVVDAVFVLGESGLLEAIEDAIKGLRVGESTGFSIAFAEDDETADAELRGKSLSYTVTLKGLKERELIPLDDDFAKSAGDVDTLDELRAQLREDLHRARTDEAYREGMDQILSQIEDGASIELPAPMIDRAVENDIIRMRGRLAQAGIAFDAYLRMTGQSETDVRDELRPSAAARLRRQLLLRKIAEEEKIAVDEQVLDEAVERIATIFQDAPNPTQAQRAARSDYVRDTLQNSLFERQLTDRLIEIATSGKELVINGWTAPAAPAADSTETVDSAGESPQVSAPAAADATEDTGEESPVHVGGSAARDEED